MDLNDIRLEIGILLQEIDKIEKLDSDYVLSNLLLSEVVLSTAKRNNSFISYVQIVKANKVYKIPRWIENGNNEIEAATNLLNTISKEIKILKVLKPKMESFENELNEMEIQFQEIYNYAAYILI